MVSSSITARALLVACWLGLLASGWMTFSALPSQPSAADIQAHALSLKVWQEQLAANRGMGPVPVPPAAGSMNYALLYQAVVVALISLLLAGLARGLGLLEILAWKALGKDPPG